MSDYWDVDADELAAYSCYLKNFMDELNDSANVLNHSYQKVSETWRDQQFKNFSKIYEENIQNIYHFIRNAEQLYSYALQVEKMIREYNEIRL